MPKKKQAFNDKQVTALLVKYIRHPTRELQDRILAYAAPLIRASMARKRIPEENRRDIFQDCSLKLLLGLPKFKPKKGTAFTFFWTIICNTIINQNRKLMSGWNNLSLSAMSSDPEIDISTDCMKTPETQHILDRIVKDLDIAFSENGFQGADIPKHQRVFHQICRSIQTEEFFTDRKSVCKKLLKLGAEKRDVQRYIDYALVKIRQLLLNAREESLGIADRTTETNVSSLSAGRIFGNIRRGGHQEID